MAHVTISEPVAGVALASIDRPPMNAMDVTLLRDVNEAIANVASDAPRALVIAGRPGCFSAGADLKAVPNYGPAEQREMVERINLMALETYALPFPVVGAITGHAIAGGLVLALCTDIRIAAAAGRYGLTEVKVGVAYPQAAIGVVAAELPPHAARVLAFGNRLIDGADCERLGVFDEVCDGDAVLGRALERAAEMASFPGEVYARTKDGLRGAAIARMREAAAADPLLARWSV
ncbi:MAG TPA: enoyl-CoA hydratase/isomerase family protein [Solirubrobacteraceae bacterium]|jgi:enoyl-CoA hydratase|nr:enoyl-CoA hydratase/isomerase family protein [Solirubrobacteraceae bacterium]